MFRVDVTDDARGWASNARRFETFPEAVEYARDLSSRWMAVRAARVVDETVPEREAVDTTDARICVNYL